MRRYLIVPFISLFILVLALLLGLTSLLFFKPTLLVTPANLARVFSHVETLKSWKWEQAEINHEWIAWNQRRVQSSFKHFCMDISTEKLALETCLDELSFDLIVSFSLSTGFTFRSLKPSVIRSQLLQIDLKDSEHEEKKKSEEKIDYYAYWDILWDKKVPDLLIAFEKITLNQKGKLSEFNFSAHKTSSHLKLEALGLKLDATPLSLTLTSDQSYEIPGDYPTQRKLHLKNLRFKAEIQKPTIPFKVTGFIDVAPFEVSGQLQLPQDGDFTSLNFLKKTLLQTTLKISLKEVRKNLSSLAPVPFNEWPAPLNAMEGEINIVVTTKESEASDTLILVADTKVDFTSKGQSLVFEVRFSSLLDLATYRFFDLSAEVDFKRVAIQLPRLSKKEAPPQFFPDSRIKRKVGLSEAEEKKNKAAPSDLKLNFRTAEAQALRIKTNLLDEDLRLKFDFAVSNGKVRQGYLDLLPLKTKIFKRPIEIPQARITFQAPLPPLFHGTINFLLPEYKITLKLEGPLSDPRHTLSSLPPLPQNDIYAVLLFGRPLADLDPDAQAATSTTNQILAQGILSLSVLYFLSGSPVEYIGYDPGSGEARAQIGLGKKTSLRLGAGQGGSRSTGIRRSLGRGWYLDNSVQTNPSSQSETRDYGVMLERIIAY